MNKITEYASGIERDLGAFDQLQNRSQLDDLRDRINGLTLCLAPEFFKLKDARKAVEAEIAQSKRPLKQLLEVQKTFLKVRYLADKIFGYSDRFHQLLCDRAEDLIADLEETGPTREQADGIDKLLDSISEYSNAHYEILNLICDKIGGKWEKDPSNPFFRPLYDEMHERAMAYSADTSADHSRLTDQLCEAVDRIVSA